MELLSYQPTTHHGHAVVVFHPGSKTNAGPPKLHQFHNHPFEFYKHPSIAAYKLNQLLYDSRRRPLMRQRMLADVNAVAEDYNLPPAHLTALREAMQFRHNGTTEPAKDANPLVEVGAHPVGALMAIHVLQAEHRRAQRAALATL